MIGKLVESGEYVRKDRACSLILVKDSAKEPRECPSPLSMVASNGHLKALRYLLRLDEFKDKRLLGEALVSAVRAKNYRAVEYLILGAKVDLNFENAAALVQAIIVGDTRMVKCIAENPLFNREGLQDDSRFFLEAINQNQARIFSYMIRHPSLFPTVDLGWLKETVAFAAPEIIRVIVKSPRFEALSEECLREVVQKALGHGRLDNASLIFAHSRSTCFFGRKCYEPVFAPLSSTKMGDIKTSILEILTIENLELVMRCAARAGNHPIFQKSFDLILKYILNSKTSDLKLWQFMESFDYATRFFIAQRDIEQLKLILNLLFDVSQASKKHLQLIKRELARMDCFYLRALILVWEKNRHMKNYFKSLALADACRDFFDYQLFNLQDEIGIYLVDRA